MDKFKYYKWVVWFFFVVIIHQLVHQKIKLDTLTETLRISTLFIHSRAKSYRIYSVYKTFPPNREPNRTLLFTKLAASLFTKIEFCSQPPVSELLLSCINQLNWDDRLQNSSHLRTRANSSLFQLVIYQKTAEEGIFVGHVKIQTYDRRGLKKSTGGDWWRAIIVGGNSLRWSVRIVDQNDGSYEGIFPIRFSGEFRLELHLEYSICEGILDPPLDWFSKGSIQGQFQPAGSIPGKIDSFLNEPHSIATPITFQIPSFIYNDTNNKMFKEKIQQECHDNMINTNCGYWMGNEYKDFDSKRNSAEATMLKQQNALISMRKPPLNTLYIYGDSQGKRFFDSISGHKLCTKLFTKCEHTYTWNYKHFSPNSHDDQFKYTGDDFNQSRVLETIKFDILRSEMRDQNSVIVINFGIHPTMTLPFTRAFQLFDSFLQMLKELRVKHRTEEFPLIIWKTTTLTVLENTPQFWNVTHFRFATKQRIDVWNSYTIGKACAFGLPIFAVHQHPQASPYKPQDTFHFKHKVFRRAEDDLMYYLIDRYKISRRQ